MLYPASKKFSAIHILPTLLTGPGKVLAEILGEPLPADALPEKGYQGRARLIVPTVRTSLAAGEPLKLKVIVLARERVGQASLFWRPMGRGKFNKIPLTHIARGVYSAVINAESIKNADIEYYIKAVSPDKAELIFPPDAPKINQTVVVIGRSES